jgi:hypothetical protein
MGTNVSTGKPAHQPTRSLPFPDWPDADRTAWARADNGQLTIVPPITLMKLRRVI